MNFKTLILLSLILLGGICTGCDRFLDVQPKDQYTEKQLLATPGGYYTAMNGLYNNLTSNSLYGKNLSYELIDVISKSHAERNVGQEGHDQNHCHIDTDDGRGALFGLG